MLVVIAGMYRSGSTFTFNIARELLLRRGSVTTISDNSLHNALAMSEGSDHLLVKSHAPDFLLTALIKKKCLPCICTFRKPEDAVASCLRVFGGDLQTATNIVLAWLEWHFAVRDRTMNCSYREIEANPLGTILRIQQYIDGTPDPKFAQELSKKYDKKRLKDFSDALVEGGGTTNIGFSYYDNETFLHRRHISSLSPISASEELSIEQISKIRSLFKAFLNAEGQYLP